ncbi:TetR/AcrR family transcriptional regulator [Nonomuraea sp. KM90]|uniref:TetR/AcrR family transcriptional regulator n=1 Tax=Nonomuraea sp. KM90 TaxID=3457428 RepID=UPI003FCD75A5
MQISLYALPVEVEDGLRQRKKLRTRRLLVDQALRLFIERGYDQTTIADIAAAADVSRRTFFSYFNSKDDLLFADADDHLERLHTAFAARPDGERALDALRRVALEVLPRTADELMGRHRHVRLQALLVRPDLQARCMLRISTAEREMATALHAAFPDELSEYQATAVTGALVAVAVRTMAAGEPPDILRAHLLWTLDLLKDAMQEHRRPPDHPQE